MRLMTLKTVGEKCALARSSIYDLMASDNFPRPVRIGPKSVRWRDTDVDEWLDNLKPAANKPSE